MIGAKLKLKENEPRKRWLKELEERQSLLQACKNADYELYLCVLFALTTGARKSEILNLTWKNTDLENKAIIENLLFYMEKSPKLLEVKLDELGYDKVQDLIAFFSNCNPNYTTISLMAFLEGYCEKKEDEIFLDL